LNEYPYSAALSSYSDFIPEGHPNGKKWFVKSHLVSGVTISLPDHTHGAINYGVPDTEACQEDARFYRHKAYRRIFFEAR
jgi:hypothetical protein